MWISMHNLRLLGRSKVWGRDYTIVPLTARRVLGTSNGNTIEWYVNERGEVVARRGVGYG
jgi:bifunctional DNA-binding transcriptional regulator/antitoxin component of YhaV-PrlF toxin-antitoxin module